MDIDIILQWLFPNSIEDDADWCTQMRIVYEPRQANLCLPAFCHDKF